MSEYRTPRRAFRAMFPRNFLEKTVEIMKKGYILGVLLLFGCGTVDSSPENYYEYENRRQLTGRETNSQPSSYCREGSCRANITNIFETAQDKNAAIVDEGLIILKLTENDFRDGVGYFSFIAESSRPNENYAYNGEYWVTSSFRSDKEVMIRGEPVTIGIWNSRMDFRNVHNVNYGNNGVPSSKKLATRVSIGPIPESYAENGEILTVFMSTEFENGSTVRDQAKIQLTF